MAGMERQCQWECKEDRVAAHDYSGLVVRVTYVFVGSECGYGPSECIRVQEEETDTTAYMQCAATNHKPEGRSLT